jgi:cell wall-associated NlpC family hydrolase
MPGAASPPRIAPPPTTGDAAATGAGAPVAGPASCANCPATPDAYVLTGTALALRGVRYRDGGTDPSGFDCSGFTQYVFGQHGIALPRNVKDQFEAGKPVKPTEIALGDLLFFSTVAPGASHVGIALGGDQFVHAPSSTGVVRVERLASAYWSQRFVGARRLK